MYLYFKKNGYMVTNTFFLSYWNGFACNQVGYKWLHWLQGVQGGSKGIFFGSKESQLDQKDQFNKRN